MPRKSVLAFQPLLPQGANLTALAEDGITQLIVIAGQTASGKSDFAIQVAQQLTKAGRPAEIVNADAMQLYRGMDIGTAKLPERDRGGITHHLIDVLEPTQDCTVVRYRELATPIIERLIQRGVLPILTGGSMFYIAGLTDELDFAPSDEALRENLEQQLQQLGSSGMHDRLSELDPTSAAKIPASNSRRVIRALEVIELTGSPYAATLPEPVSRWRTTFIGLQPNPELAKQRIANRAQQMLQSGLIAEAEELAKRGLSRTAGKAIGYRQALAMQRGEVSEAEAVREIIQLTERYAKRQRSWFRRDKRIHWLREPYDLAAALQLIG